MTKSDFEKAIKKLADEDFQLTMEELDLADKSHHMKIQRTSINRREMKLRKEFQSEMQPDLTIVGR